MKGTQGFSLIEVLVALLLTTVGVLGMVALQGRSIQYTQDSVQRNTAVELANDLMEIMRANPKALFDKVPPASPMNSGINSNSVFFKDKAEDFSNREDCVRDEGELPANAQQQRDCWADRVEEQLPEAADLLTSDMYICRSASPGQCTDDQGSMIEIQLAWRVRPGACLDAVDPDATICTYRVRVQL
ncbi:Pilus assembly protein PilV [Pseudomonas sp. 8Z]|uniref:type IV pilus modification protein PilV n=1 Tax=Pseudomonas sp. 8Z TaxID=2653166 RepID=UPI0012EF3D7F|nr:type IV pilus modification protein PilV [Pseudomonas sp. 8Z]VXD02547.1 Pilus assembly protein PilV [Pseudomonas sp. 8Z]